MMRRLLDMDACAVQGSTYIRNTRGRRVSALARAVDAEFFVTHFIYFPAMEVLASSGYFGGSNALWRTRVLTSYAFDPKMLTEDVDVSARVLLDGQVVSFCPEARSGELAPANARALIAQRLRWFMGWEQVTHKYYWRVFFSGLPLHRKLGFCYLFHLRWILLLAAVLAAVINPVRFCHSPLVGITLLPRRHHATITQQRQPPRSRHIDPAPCAARWRRSCSCRR
jgi:biofilm PGA synthesis N-glycosyltransferase PgaC